MKSIIAVLLLSLSATTLFAQTLDTGILGSVTDASGAVIAGATVAITQSATGVKRST